jgi:preprotein translocase subunit SecF
MFSLIKPGTNFDFIGRAPFFIKLTLATLAAALVVIFTPGLGIKFGLDFTGGYEVLVAFDKAVDAEAVRSEVRKLDLGDSSVQAYEVPGSPKTHFLVRVQRAQVLGQKDLEDLNGAFQKQFGDKFKAPVLYNPEIGNMVDVVFTSTAGVDTSSAAITQAIATTDHKVRKIRKVGRPDEARYAVTLMGVDVTIVEALKSALDPSASAVRIEFVGPTAGKQLRDDGILALVYAMLCMMIYIALRFDFFYSPGAIACVFHDAIITIGLLALLGEEFSLATIAGLLTLVGYSINDTIIVYDRIREMVGKAQGTALKDVLNRAVNDTLARTVMTSFTTLLACVCLMWFGRGTVLAHLGLIMFFGIVIGTYSSIYVAAPLFMWLRLRFGPQDTVGKGRATAATGIRTQPSKT